MNHQQTATAKLCSRNSTQTWQLRGCGCRGRVHFTLRRMVLYTIRQVMWRSWWATRQPASTIKSIKGAMMYFCLPTCRTGLGCGQDLTARSVPITALTLLPTWRAPYTPAGGKSSIPTFSTDLLMEARVGRPFKIQILAVHSTRHCSTTRTTRMFTHLVLVVVWLTVHWPQRMSLLRCAITWMMVGSILQC